MSEPHAVSVATLFRAAPPAGARLDRLLADREASGAARALAEADLRVRACEADFLQAREAMQAGHSARLDAQAAISRAALAALEAALAEALGALAAGFARAVLDSEPRLGADTLASLASEALAAAPAGSLGTLRVEPDSAPMAETCIPPGWRVQPDPALPTGHVEADVDGTAIAASLALRTGQLAARLEAGA